MMTDLLQVQVIAIGCQLCEPIMVKLHDRRTIYLPLEPGKCFSASFT